MTQEQFEQLTEGTKLRIIAISTPDPHGFAIGTIVTVIGPRAERLDCEGKFTSYICRAEDLELVSDAELGLEPQEESSPLLAVWRRVISES